MKRTLDVMIVPVGPRARVQDPRIRREAAASSRRSRAASTADRAASLALRRRARGLLQRGGGTRRDLPRRQPCGLRRQGHGGRQVPEPARLQDASSRRRSFHHRVRRHGVHRVRPRDGREAATSPPRSASASASASAARIPRLGRERASVPRPRRQAPPMKRPERTMPIPRPPSWHLPLPPGASTLGATLHGTAPGCQGPRKTFR